MPGAKRSRVQSTGSTDNEQKGGWGAVAKRKAKMDANQDSSSKIYDFFLKDGETVQIQFLSDEPYCSDFYTFKVGGKWRTCNTQLAVRKHCLMEQAGLKSTWRAAFKVLDFRGKWDKDTKSTESDKGLAYDEVTPQEKLWKVSNTVALALKSFIDRKKVALTDVVLEVTRSGSDKSTSYTFEIARNEDDDKLKTLSFKEEYPTAEECCKPPTDENLVAWGVINDSDAEDEDDGLAF